MRVKRRNKGLFITFEGGEGVGKTTLIERVYKALDEKGFSVKKTRAPGGGKFGEQLRKILLEREGVPFGKKAELFLFLADRAEHVEKLILPELENNHIVLCDRFSDSTRAYQGVTCETQPHFLQTLCRFAANGLEPDLTILLDLDPMIGLSRLKKGKKQGDHPDRIEQKKMAFHLDVRRAFLQFAKEEPKRFRVLDANLELSEVFQQTMDEIMPCIKNKVQIFCEGKG